MPRSRASVVVVLAVAVVSAAYAADGPPTVIVRTPATRPAVARPVPRRRSRDLPIARRAGVGGGARPYADLVAQSAGPD